MWNSNVWNTQFSRKAYVAATGRDNKNEHEFDHVDLISRSDARDIGQTYYFTGKPCKRGHIANRYVSNKTCVVCDSLRKKKVTDSQESVRVVRFAPKQGGRINSGKQKYIPTLIEDKVYTI